ncbi:MAG: immunoglobulin-like domain-containing protein [Clostridium sp.]|uniref:immunoglobulin-like domain-containing protein n=1 Tax=Clostridium sp. TaxID=1506 RepID=UPI003D6D7029
MNKKITSSALAALMIAGSTSFSAFAAMSSGTVVIGNKAYDMEYANDVKNAEEIGKALVESGVVYVKGFDGKWIDNTSGKTVETSVIPAVVYKDAKGKETNFDAKDTDVVAASTVSSIKLTSSVSSQAVVGTRGIITAVATDKDSKVVPGAKVVFEVTTPLQSQNKQYKVTVVADKDGVATLTNEDGKAYVRNAADADTIVAYAEENSAIRTEISKVYWGVKQILTVTADTVTPVSGGTVTYTAKLSNPVIGEAMVGRQLRVIFKENIGAEGTRATATSNNDFQAKRLFQDVNGQNNTLLLTTNADGIAKFTVTGNHESVTPIVFYDKETFYTNSLYDSSQYLASFAGNNNERFDARELNAVAPTAAFTNSAYKITSDVTVDSFCSSTAFTRGKKYVITVNKADGTVFAGGTINVGVNELLNGYDSRARIIATATGNPTTTPITFNNGSNNVLSGTVNDGEGKATKTSIILDAKGQATFVLASDRINTVATPVVWIDGDTPAMYTGKTNGQYDATLDTIQKLNKVTFVNSFINDGKLTVTDNTEVSDSVSKIENASFIFNLYDQTNDLTNPRPVGSARMNYVVANTGSDDITVNLNVFNAGKIVVDQKDTAADTSVIVKPGQYRTIAGNVNSAQPTLLIKSTNSTSGAAATVTASAEIFNVDGTLLSKFTSTSSARATFDAVTRVEASIAAGTFVGKLDATVNKAGQVQLNIPGSRYINFNISSVATGVGTGVASSGLVTTTSKDFTVNDFNQATVLTNDVLGKTANQKLVAALAKDAAVQVTFKMVDSKPVIETIKVLYTEAMYNENRVLDGAVDNSTQAELVILANAAVNKLEATIAPAKDLKLKADLEAAENEVIIATAAVNKLVAGDYKILYTAKINVANTTIKAARVAFDKNLISDAAVAKLLEATVAVNKAVSTKLVVDIDAAQLLVTALPESPSKEALKVKLSGIVTVAEKDKLDITSDAADLSVTYNGVASTLVLPIVTTNNSTVTWAEKVDTLDLVSVSGNVATIKNSVADNKDDVVTLTATIKKGITTLTRDFDITITEGKTTADQAASYATLKNGVESKVAAYESAGLILTTQTLVDAAKAKATIVTTGLTVSDINAFKVRTDLVDAKVVAAQDLITATGIKATLALTVATPAAATSTITPAANTKIAWACSVPANLVGIVYTTPARTLAVQTETLTATITVGATVLTQTFTVTIPVTGVDPITVAKN